MAGGRRPQKKKRTKRGTKLKRKILASLDLPEETVEAVPKATLVAREDLLIENHKGILQYTPEEIRLYTAQGVISIRGKDLSMLELGATRAYVKGSIRGVLYEE